MKDIKKNPKSQIVKEEFESGYEQEYEQDRQPADKGTYSKPLIVQNMVEAFDHFRQGMDKLTTAYPIMESYDSELYRRTGRFGEAMSKLIEGFSKLIEQQGGSIESITKPKALQQYFGQKGMAALGMNESKTEVFNARVDINIGRIKSIMENTKR